jgi:circadian clock protein KaiC
VERYIEIESRLKRILGVVKVRDSAHSNELREFEITDAGIVIGQPLANYSGLLCGQPVKNP